MRRNLRSYDLRTSESHILGTNYRASLRFYDLLILRCIITYNFSLNIAGLVARSQLPRPLLSLSHTLRVRAAVAATADALAHAPAVATCCGCSCSCGRSCTRALLHTFRPPRPVVVALAHVPAVATCCGRSHTPPLLLTLALAVAAAAAVVALVRSRSRTSLRANSSDVTSHVSGSSASARPLPSPLRPPLDQLCC